MNTAQSIAGLAAAALVPTLVVLIAANYHERQQAQALGILASIPAIASGLAFVIAGFIATALSWRLLIWSDLLAVARCAHPQLPPDAHPAPEGHQDRLRRRGAVGAGDRPDPLCASTTSTPGAWCWQTTAAPFSILGLSPVPILLVARHRAGPGLLRLVGEARRGQTRRRCWRCEVLDSPGRAERCDRLPGGRRAQRAVSFLIPLYIQIVQGGTPLFTSVAIVPYAIAVAAAAILSVRLYDRLTPRRIGVDLLRADRRRRGVLSLSRSATTGARRS